ncbi:hypothetical protein ACS0TY_016142 [Phlomoides rotata]
MKRSRDEMSWQQGLKIPNLDFDFDDNVEEELNASQEKDINQQITISEHGPTSVFPKTIPVSYVVTSQTIKKPSSSAAEKRGVDLNLKKDASKKSKYFHKEKVSSDRAQEKRKGKGKDKEGIHRAANDFYTLELPKGLAELTKEKSVDFVRTLHTPDDNFFYSNVVSEENDELNRENSYLREELENAKRNLESAKEEAFNAGVRSRVELFRSVAGQKFLKELHEGLIEVYRNSALYLNQMGPHMGH